MLPNNSLFQIGVDSGGAGPTQLDAVLRLPLKLNRDGSLGATTLEFADPGPTLHVIEQVDDGWLTTMLWHAPTVAAGLLLVVPPVVLVVIVRAARRRQRFGHFYCVKCNYDLTGPGGMPPETSGERGSSCPECGVHLGSRPAQLGRTLTSRVLKVVMVSLVLLGLCAGTLLATLERSNPTNSWRPPWMEVTSRTGMLPRLVRAHDSLNDARGFVSTYSVPGGRKTGQLEQGRGAYQTAVTRNSEWCVWVQAKDGVGPVVEVANLQTSNRHTLYAPAGNPWNITLLKPSLKPGTVLLGYTNSLHRAGATNEAVLARFDLASGTSSIVGRVGTLRSSHLSNGGAFVVREDDQRVHWAYITYGPRTPGTLTGSVFNVDSKEFEFQLAGTWWVMPTISADGLSVEVGAGGGTGGPSATRILLADGTQSAGLVNPGVQPAVASNGTSVAWCNTTGAVRQLQVLSSDGAVRGLLRTNPGTPGAPVISRDGRWAAVTVIEQRTTWTGAAAMDAYVLVWDLSALEDSK